MAPEEAVNQEEDLRPKTRLIRRDLVLLVFVPTLLAAIYYFLLAADVYVSESKFSVNLEQNGALSSSPLGSLIPSNITNGANIQEATVVKTFIFSPAMVDMLRKKVGLENIYDNNMADAFARIPRGLKMEEYLERFRDKVDVYIDDATGITTLKVRAFNPQDAKKVADSIMNYAEEYVNQMSSRMQNDEIKFAKAEVDKSEKLVMDSLAKIADFRAENQNFDPNISTANAVGITSKLEQELASTNAQISSLRNYMQPGSPKVAALENRARALRQQIDVQTDRLTNSDSSQLANINDQYSALVLERDFNLKRLEITLTALETAQAEAMKKRRYLLRIVEPTLPQMATEPRKLREIFTIFIALLTIYTLGGLIISAIKDHVRP